MARKKKASTASSTSDPLRGALDILTKQAKKSRLGHVNFQTVTDTSKNWRWIDFNDPNTGQPSLLLEWLWGARGMLAGRMLKIEAEEGVGKSSYMMMMYGIAQQTSNAWCIHAEGELATAPQDFISSFGCDPDKIISPEFDVRSIDECFNKLDWLSYQLRRAAANESDKVIDPDMKYPIVAGVDSVSSFGSAANMEDDGVAMDSGKGGLGLHSRFLSQWFRDKWSAQVRRDMLLMVIAQVREKIDTGPSFPGSVPKRKEITTIAARPLNFHCTYRLHMRSKPLYDDERKVYGELVTFKTTKNKLSPKGRQIVVPLIWDQGYDLTSATIDMLNMLSPIKLSNGYEFTLNRKSGGWIDVPALQDKAFRSGSEAEILQGIYANQDLLMGLREALRIRGFGFDFESRYVPSHEEVKDIEQTEDEAAVATVREE